MTIEKITKRVISELEKQRNLIAKDKSVENNRFKKMTIKEIDNGIYGWSFFIASLNSSDLDEGTLEEIVQSAYSALSAYSAIYQYEAVKAFDEDLIEFGKKTKLRSDHSQRTREGMALKYTQLTSQPENPSD